MKVCIWKEKKTTGICILEKSRQGLFPQELWCRKCEDIFGKDVLKKISPYLKETKVIAIDASLTRGRGKGKMRLYEKFLSQKVFREAKVNPLPPALIPKFTDFGIEIRKKLEERGFALDLNLIEVFPTLVKKIVQNDFSSKVLGTKFLRCQSENQKSSLICAILAYLHYSFKTRYLGYRDGFLFLPEISFWQKSWQEKFSRAWQEKPYLHYRYLVTNLFKK